jgi:tight adherence protein B
MMSVIIGLLITIIAFCVIALRADARARRVNRQLATALPTKVASAQPAASVRLPSRRHRRHLLNWLLQYNSDGAHQWPSSYVVVAGILVALFTAIVGTLLTPLSVWMALACGVLIGGCTARGLFGWQRRRYADRLLRQLPDAIELVVSAVRAGLPVAEAFHAVAREMPEPTRAEFVTVTHELALGRPTDEALRTVYDRSDVREYAMFSVTLGVVSKSGGRLAETLQILGDTVRQRVILSGRAKALASEAKLSARVLSCLPFVAGAFLYFERPDSLDPLFYDPRGKILFTIGLISLAMGIFTMRRMIRNGTTV